jgi:beta-1,2-mannosidase
MIQKVNYLKFLIPFIFPVALTGCRTSPDPEVSAEEDSTWALLPFSKVDSVNPVLEKGLNTFLCPVLKKQVQWDEKDVFNPAAIVRNDTVFLLFRAEDTIGKFAGTSRLGLAFSTDGLHFSKMKTPVFYPDNDSLKVYEWEGGVEDPRVVETTEGKYIMTYTSYDGTTARLMLATSPDLKHWSKHGIVLRGKYKNIWSKSGAIVARRSGSRIIAERINGKYWMYFGDTDLFMAMSDDLIHWQPLEENGSLKKVLSPRKGYFDSRLVESGPYALVQENGILLIYNGMNLDGDGRDTTLAAGAYCGGQALFDVNDPSRVIARLEKNFIMPEASYEIEGQVNQVCFLEGMIPFRNRWYLYYGTADSKIAVAVKEGL